jgi:hypothetical protein
MRHGTPSPRHPKPFVCRRLTRAPRRTGGSQNRPKTDRGPNESAPSACVRARPCARSAYMRVGVRACARAKGRAHARRRSAGRRMRGCPKGAAFVAAAAGRRRQIDSFRLLTHSAADGLECLPSARTAGRRRAGAAVRRSRRGGCCCNLCIHIYVVATLVSKTRRRRTGAWDKCTHTRMHTHACTRSHDHARTLTLSRSHTLARSRSHARTHAQTGRAVAVGALPPAARARGRPHARHRTTHGTCPALALGRRTSRKVPWVLRVLPRLVPTHAPSRSESCSR